MDHLVDDVGLIRQVHSSWQAVGETGRISTFDCALLGVICMQTKDPAPGNTLISTDGDAAVGGFYLNGWAALSDLRVDPIADGTLDCVGEGD